MAVTLRDLLSDLLVGAQDANAYAADEAMRQYGRLWETDTATGAARPRTTHLTMPGGIDVDVPLPALYEPRPAAITKLRAQFRTQMELGDSERPEPQTLPPGDVFGLNVVERRDVRALGLGVTLRTGPSPHATLVDVEVELDLTREPEATAKVRDTLDREFSARLNRRTVPTATTSPPASPAPAQEHQTDA